MVESGLEKELLLSSSRRYERIVQSPQLQEIDTTVIESCNGIVRGISAIDQLFSHWEHATIDEHNVSEYLADMNVCSTIRTLCLGISSVERLIEDPHNEDLLSVIDEQYIYTGLQIPKERRMVIDEVTYTNIHHHLQRNEDGFVIQKTASPIKSQEQHGVYVSEHPIELDQFRQALIGRLEETIDGVTKTHNIDTTLSSSNPQIFRSQRDVDFFRTKLDIIFHDYGNPLQITEGYFALIHDVPLDFISNEMNSLAIPSTSAEIVELSHQLIHAHEESVIIPLLRDGLQDFAQAAFDRERMRKGFVQSGVVNVEEGVAIIDHDLMVVGYLQDSDMPQFAFSRVLLLTIIDNCLKNTAKALEAKRKANEAKGIDSPDPNITIRFGIDTSAKNIFIFVEDHGSGIPNKLKQGFGRKMTDWPEESGISGTGIGMSTLNDLTKELCGENPKEKPLPKRLYPDPQYDEGARIIMMLPVDNVIDV